MAKAKILILDIETTPNVAYVWRFFKENISPKQVKENGMIMSYAAKWLGSDEIIYEDMREEGIATGGDDYYLVANLVNLLDEADIVVAHFGKKFDLPKIKGRCLILGLKPPSPYKIIDTCLIARKHFGLPANSLEYLTDVLGCTPKLAHKNFPGFELWLECLKDNLAAWEECEEYNVGDVISLEEVYLKMLPWIDDHPNMGVYEEAEVPICPKCGGRDHQKRGFYVTNVGKYQRLRCNTCGGWHRTRFTEYDKEARKQLVVNAI